jgi:proteasome lid subunit RPN8/RPN11
MPKNLNSFVLTDNIIETMKQKLKKTENIQRELGFNLCHVEGSNELKDDTHCIGTECSIPLEKTCKVGKKVGTFHTHPTGDSTPSLADLWGGYYYGVECIGSISDKKIACYIRKDKERDPNTNKMFASNVARFKSLSAGMEHHITKQRGYQVHMSKYRDLQYTRKFLTEKYFDAINITE